MDNFFPNTGFAWAFLAALALLLSVSAYVDWRETVIPKWLTIPMFGLGILVSLVRGGWLGYQEAPLFLLPTGNVLLGVLDGLLFAALGCLVGFGMLFVMWLLGTCGGGDVKLFAALGTWLGPVYPIFVLAGSIVVLLVQVIVKLVAMGFSGKNLLKLAKANRAPTQEGASPTPNKLRITYSFPVAVATVAVLLWFFRFDLCLVPRPTSKESAQAHARNYLPS